MNVEQTNTQRAYGVIPSDVDKRDYTLSFKEIDPSTIPESYASPLPPFVKIRV